MIISIRQNQYHATIHLDQLVNLPLYKLRKLFKIIQTEPDNYEEGQILGEYLLGEKTRAREAWSEASNQYKSLWEPLPTIQEDAAKFKPLGPKKINQKRHRVQASNNRLIAAVKKSKARHTKLCKMLEIYDHYHY